MVTKGDVSALEAAYRAQVLDMAVIARGHPKAKLVQVALPAGHVLVAELDLALEVGALTGNEEGRALVCAWLAAYPRVRMPTVGMAVQALDLARRVPA